ncbi:HDOD domain-containing protein [Mangrovitalea sediminis]|uniref:HDOD domain-containing protein n=1 Tax=Mangrovitalea sediminis TaxID=1982043 RepID=UPI001D0CF8BA|nr:HDOD domain-containing protein [Mangrovitalea sediminis]
MSVPGALMQVFGALSPPVEPRVFDAAKKPLETILKMVVLADDQGRQQVVFPAAHLLDIDRLNKLQARELRALPRSDVQQLLTRFQMLQLPAVPSLTGLPTILDSDIDLGGNDLLIESGYPDQWLSISVKDFLRLAPDARSFQVSVPLSRVEVNDSEPDRDQEQFEEALRRFTKLRIKQRLEDTLELPPLPETAQKIIHLRVNPNAGVGDLADIVESDPSLAAQVVSWASSSFYAAPGRVRSVNDAIVRVLGFDLVMNLAMGLALGRTLKQPQDAPEGLMDYWPQAIWMAQSAGILTGLMPRDRRPAFGLSYLAGLLHNFGYLVLAHVFPPYFSLICRYVEANQHIDTKYVEHFLLGITREQIGSQLMDVWAMPEEVVVALRHQKNPAYEGPHAVYAKILLLARQLLTDRGVALGPRQAVDDTLMASLGLDEAKVAEAFDELVGNSADISTMAGMMAG